MADNAPSFVCACGADLEFANARIEGVDEMGVEIAVECPDCDAEYFAFVQPQHFCPKEEG